MSIFLSNDYITNSKLTFVNHREQLNLVSTFPLWSAKLLDSTLRRNSFCCQTLIYVVYNNIANLSWSNFITRIPF